jgi:hypothetical protein
MHELNKFLGLFYFIFTILSSVSVVFGELGFSDVVSYISLFSVFYCIYTNVVGKLDKFWYVLFFLTFWSCYEVFSIAIGFYDFNKAVFYSFSFMSFYTVCNVAFYVYRNIYQSKLR